MGGGGRRRGGRGRGEKRKEGEGGGEGKGRVKSGYKTPRLYEMVKDERGEKRGCVVLKGKRY